MITHLSRISIQPILMIFLSFLVGLPVHAQKNISEIRAEYKRVEDVISTSQLIPKELRFNCPDYPEVGTVKWYFEKGELIKLTYSHGYEHSGSTTNFYFKDGNLFFLFKNEGVWYIGENNTVWDEFDEYRIYLVDNEPIKCLQKHVKYSSQKEENPTDKIPNEEVDCSSLSYVLQQGRTDLEFLAKVKKANYDNGECILPD